MTTEKITRFICNSCYYSHKYSELIKELTITISKTEKHYSHKCCKCNTSKFKIHSCVRNAI